MYTWTCRIRLEFYKTKFFFFIFHLGNWIERPLYTIMVNYSQLIFWIVIVVGLEDHFKENFHNQIYKKKMSCLNKKKIISDRSILIKLRFNNETSPNDLTLVHVLFKKKWYETNQLIYKIAIRLSYISNIFEFQIIFVLNFIPWRHNFKGAW